MATKARRTWLGRRAKASGSSPLKEKAGKNHKGPRAAAGAFSLWGNHLVPPYAPSFPDVGGARTLNMPAAGELGVRFWCLGASRPAKPASGGGCLVPTSWLLAAAGHPLAPAGDDVLELAADEVAEAVVDRAQQSERDEDPRLGVRVALGDDPARCLGAPDHVGDELVHLAHLATQRAADLGVVCGLRQRLDPEVDEHGARGGARLEVGLADRLQPVRRVLLTPDGLLPEHAHLLPDRVEAGEVELPLRREMAVENRLGDPGLAGDLRCGRAAVASLREDAASRFDDCALALGAG